MHGTMAKKQQGKAWSCETLFHFTTRGRPLPCTPDCPVAEPDVLLHALRHLGHGHQRPGDLVKKLVGILLFA
jgi:hypothetical protein